MFNDRMQKMPGPGRIGNEHICVAHVFLSIRQGVFADDTGLRWINVGRDVQGQGQMINQRPVPSTGFDIREPGDEGQQGPDGFLWRPIEILVVPGERASLTQRF